MSNRRTDLLKPNFLKKIGILTGIITEAVTQIFLYRTEEELEYWISKKDSIRKQLRTMFKVTDLFVDKKERWRKFYQKYFSLNLNFDNLVIPEMPTEGSWRLLIIAQGLKLNQIFDAWKKHFKCWRYNDNLDKVISQNTRGTKEAYAIWVRDGVEPDEKYLGKSTNQADADMKIGVTLLERMIHELVFFDDTSTHLDIKGVTFCTGSRRSAGDVPCVYGSSALQGVRVYWCYLAHSSSASGLREAVSQ